MKIKFIYKFIPVPIFYTNWMPSKDTGGYFFGYIAIRPKYKLDESIHMHELEHAKQNIKCFYLLLFLYLFNRKVRMWAEVRAYQKQLQYKPAILNVKKYREYYALFLTNKKYRLNINIKQAMNLLLYF